jgi:acyl-CoA dehydrogenase
MLPRTIYTSVHEAFRLVARKFLEREARPRLAAWESQGHPERAFWVLAGSQGLLGYAIPREYGGLGADRRHGAILREEMARLGIAGTGLGVLLHADVIAPFIVRHGTEEQKQRWLPRMARGETIGALGMTERCAGSDAKAIQTAARRSGDEWVINGSKIFITNGAQADLVVVAARTDTSARSSGGISLLLVEGDRPGFHKRGPMAKIGLKYEDAGELFFNDVRVPLTALLGEEGRGFQYLMQGMSWERMQIAIMGVAVCETVIDMTVRHVAHRQAFGKTLLDLQNVRFKLAECLTETRLGRLFVDRCLEMEIAGQLDPVDAAMAKLWCTELQGRVVDTCLQMHGGSGYMADHAVARAFVDARVTRIYGGANEVLREVVARSFNIGEHAS